MPTITLTAQTPLGRAALWLLVAFAASLLVFLVLVEAGQRGGETLVSNPWLAASGLGAAFSAIAAGVLAIWSIVARRERGVAVFVAAVVGLLVGLWVSLEVAFPH